MTIVLSVDQNNIIPSWMKNILPEIETEDLGNHIAFGVIDTNKEKILAGIVLNNYIEKYKNIAITVVADNPSWAQKKIIKQIASYAFDNLKCNRITSRVRESNIRALKFNAGLGFQKEGNIRLGFGDENMVIMGLLKKDFIYKDE